MRERTGDIAPFLLKRPVPRPGVSWVQGKPPISSKKPADVGVTRHAGCGLGTWPRRCWIRHTETYPGRYAHWACRHAAVVILAGQWWSRSPTPQDWNWFASQLGGNWRLYASEESVELLSVSARVLLMASRLTCRRGDGTQEGDGEEKWWIPLPAYAVSRSLRQSASATPPPQSPTVHPEPASPA